MSYLAKATLDNLLPGTPLLLDGEIVYAQSRPAKDGQFKLRDGRKTHVYDVQVVDVASLLVRIEDLEAREPEVIEREPEVIEREVLVDPNPALEERIAELEATIRGLIKVRR